MTSFVLVRHASADSPAPGAHLTPDGQMEARALARRLREWSFDAAWSSDMERAVQTAEAILAERESPTLQRSPLLREVEVLPEGLLARDPEGYAAWERGVTSELVERLEKWLSNPSLITRRSSVLVVSHAGPLRVLICLILGLPPEAQWSFRLDRASLSVVERAEDMGTILLLNDRCHLP
ncbi:MAG: histidine phosphatase family protein [Chloroflexota bacterium]